jgi:predicted dehydrogenase
VKKNQKIRVGFIGAGGICRSRHLPGLQKLDDVEVIAVCNRSEASSKAVADAFGIPEIESDWRTLVERKDIDAVFIGTWPYMHKEMAIAVLDAGKHCFCQARMCGTLNEARQMLQVAQRTSDLVHMICPPPHRMPFEPWIKKAMADGMIGELTFVELRSASGANLNPNTFTWREDVDYSGEQVLAMGIYAETLNAWVGPYETLAANVSTPIATKTIEGEEVEVKIPQIVSITGQLANGAICHEHHMGLVADTTTPVNEITLFGTEGTIRHAFLSGEIYYGAKGQPLEKVNVPAQLTRDWHVEQDFIDAVRKAQAGQPWQVSPDFVEGHQYMIKVHAVHESTRLGRAINLVIL